MDFLFDATAQGGRLKWLTVGDDFTRECLLIEVGTSLPAARVIAGLSALVVERGAPERIRCDNGPEFIAQVLQHWLTEHGAATALIEPGHPWQNGFRESFHGRFRDEFLAGNLFVTVAEARVLAQGYLREYNQERPHQSLGYRTPAEFKAAWAQAHSQERGA